MYLQLYTYRPITPNGKSFVNLEVESLQMEVVVVYFKEVSRHFKGGAEKNTIDLRIVSAVAQIRTADPQEHELKE
jgi:hypothetical protein